MSKVTFMRGTEIVWKKHFPGYPSFTLKNNIIFGKVGGMLVGIHPNSGDVLWNFTYKHNGYSNIESDFDDYIYAINNFGEQLGAQENGASLSCIDRITGDIKWEKTFPNPIRLPAVSGIDEVAVATHGVIIVLDKETGIQKWTLPFKGKNPTFLAAYKDTILYMINNSIFMIGMKSGLILNKVGFSQPLRKVVLSKDHLVLIGGEVTEMNGMFEDQYIEAISLKTFKSTPRVLALNEGESIEEIVNQALILLNNDKLICKSLSGEIKWVRKLRFEDKFILSHECDIIFLKDGPTLYALSSENGEEYWTVSMKTSATLSKPFIYKGLVHDFLIN
ncbi:outer membrane protein assembly factor BamB family protein [Pseudoneobacillus sp. C159]